MENIFNPVSRLVMLLVALMYTVTLRAQSMPTSGQVVLRATDHLALYQVGTDGQLMLLTNLPDSFGIWNTLNADWSIPSWRQIVPSPNGQYIAFVAFRPQGGETALYVYNVNQGTVKQINLPGLGSINWSPRSDGIVLAPPQEYLDIAIVLDRVYRYDLPSDTLITLPNAADGSRGPVLWLPDNQHIVYTGPRANCDPPCVDVHNLYVTDRAGANTAMLTELQTQIPAASIPYGFCYPRKALWSDEQQRIFYSLTCTDTTEQQLDLLYSVTLNQDNRLEGSLASLFPYDTYSAIVNLFPVGNTVYIAVDGFSQPYIGGTEAGYTAGRVLRVDAPGSLTVINEQPFDINLGRNLIRAEMSPDHQFLAVVGYDSGVNKTGYLAVIDISTGQFVSEQQTPNQVCNVEWVDNQKLLYTEFPESQCNPYQKPGNTILYDTQTNSSQIVNSPGETLWLLLPPG